MLAKSHVFPSKSTIVGYKFVWNIKVPINGEVFWVYVSWDTRYVSMISLLYSEYPIFPIKVPIVRCTQFSDTPFSHYRYGTATTML